MSPLSVPSLPSLPHPNAVAPARAAQAAIALRPARKGIGPASAVANPLRFRFDTHFDPAARDTARIAGWHREWAEARRSLVTEAYLADAGNRTGTLFDFAA